MADQIVTLSSRAKRSDLDSEVKIKDCFVWKSHTRNDNPHFYCIPQSARSFEFVQLICNP